MALFDAQTAELGQLRAANSELSQFKAEVNGSLTMQQKELDRLHAIGG